MILNINQLRAFVTAARLNSVTDAARELMVTTPAITMQIRRLEGTLGIRLMHRKGNSVQLTQVGQTIYTKYNRIFEDMKEMEIFLHKLTNDTSGVLRIGCPQTLTEYAMSKAVAAFKKAYPEVKIVLGQGTNSEVLRDIRNQVYDIGVIHCRESIRKMKIVPVVKEDILLVASPHSTSIMTSEVSVMQLSAIPLIIPEEGSALREVVLSYLKRFNVVPNVVVESTNVDLTKTLTSEDWGASFVTKSDITDELEKGLLKAISILEGPPIMEYGIAYLQRQYLKPTAWAFVDFVRKMGRT